MADARPFFQRREFMADPYPVYHQFRDEAPVQWNEALGSWLVTSHEAVTAALADSRLSSDRTESYLARFPDDIKATLAPFAGYRADMILFIDPPKHTRLRGLVQKAFTPRVIGLLRPRVEHIVDELLAPAKERGGFDIISDLAEPLPGIVIAELLGVPPADRAQFKRWANDFAAAISGVVSLAQVYQGQSSLLAMADYLSDIAALRRQEPKEDLMSALVAVEEQGDVLSEHELLATCALLLVAGNETTTNLIGNGLLALLRHPDQLARLRADGELIRSTVEELLRYDSPVQASYRVAREEISFDGKTIAPRQSIALLLGAANRDPAQFDEPDRLNLARGNRRHLSFAHGPHFCLGAALARLEGQIAIGTTVNRFPALQLATDQPSWRPLFAFRGLQSLPVTC